MSQKMPIDTKDSDPFEYRGGTWKFYWNAHQNRWLCTCCSSSQTYKDYMDINNKVLQIYYDYTDGIEVTPYNFFLLMFGKQQERLLNIPDIG